MKGYHEKTSAAWDAMAEKGWGENRKPSPFFKKFYEQHRAELGKDVLDVGCGNGAYIVPLAQDGYNVVGLDLSEGMLNGAKTRIEAEKVQASLVRGKSSELPFLDDNFDFVLSIGAMHHNTWEDIEKSFAEVKRVLRPGKLFLFQGRSVSDIEPTREQIVDPGLTSIDTKGIKKDVVHHYFTKEELLTLALQNGFEVVEGPEEKISNRETESDNQHARWWVVFRKK